MTLSLCPNPPQLRSAHSPNPKCTYSLTSISPPSDNLYQTDDTSKVVIKEDLQRYGWKRTKKWWWITSEPAREEALPALCLWEQRKESLLLYPGGTQPLSRQWLGRERAEQNQYLDISLFSWFLYWWKNPKRSMKTRVHRGQLPGAQSRAEKGRELFGEGKWKTRH